MATITGDEHNRERGDGNQSRPQGNQKSNLSEQPASEIDLWQRGSGGAKSRIWRWQAMTDKRFIYPADHFADAAAEGRRYMANLAESQKFGPGGFVSSDGTVVFSREEIETLDKSCRMSVRNMRGMISSACRGWLQRVPSRQRKRALVDWLFEREAKEWVEALNSDDGD
jgi:hypothetical protein